MGFHPSIIQQIKVKERMFFCLECFFKLIALWSCIWASFLQKGRYIPPLSEVEEISSLSLLVVYFKINDGLQVYCTLLNSYLSKPICVKGQLTHTPSRLRIPPALSPSAPSLERNVRAKVCRRVRKFNVFLLRGVPSVYINNTLSAVFHIVYQSGNFFFLIN